MKKPYRNMPEIIFDHYKLRTIHKNDYLDMYAYGKDSEVTKYLSWGPYRHESEAKKTIKAIFYPRVRNGLPRGYAIVDLNSGHMIGTIDFHSKKKNDNGAEIGYVIHKDYWNQGVMTRALAEIIKVGFDYLKYDRIYIKHIKKNVASQRVIEKNLFQKVRIEPFVYTKQNEMIEDELFVYELTKERYNANQ